MKLNLSIIHQYGNRLLLTIIFLWLIYIIGFHSSIKEICRSHDAKPYFYIDHDFKTVKEQDYYSSKAKYHCLKEIKTPICFAGQKEILFEKKCKVNEILGGNYGYIQ